MPEGLEFLDIHDAVSLMTGGDPEPKPAADPAASADPAPAAADPAAAPASTNPEQPSADGADAVADPNAQVSDPANTTTDGVDPGANALPPIEPPVSWTTEEKAEWQSLSRKAQEAIQRREQDNVTALRNAQNGAAEQRKSVDVEITRLKGLNGQIESHLNEKMTDLAKDFPDVKTEADLVALSSTDPSRYLNFKARLEAIGSIKQAQELAQGRLTAEQERANNELAAQAKTVILKDFPTWSDPVVARKELTDLQDYAVKNGVPEAAARGNVDPYVLKFVQKAMAYDRAQAAAAKAVQNTPPRVVTPGAQSSTPRADAKAKSRATQIEKLNNSGDIMDAMSLILDR